MALVLADRVQETTTTIGTGTVTLAGAVSGFQSFSAIGDGNTTYYAITSGAAWEAGIGTYTAAGTTLARTTVLASSAAGAAISLSGTSNVFVTYPAEKSVNLNAVGGLSFGGLAISSPAWSTNGIGLVQAAATATDTSTAASGTVAAAYMNYFAPQTYAASNTGVTVTSLYGTYFSTPVAGTNVTATARYGVGADSIVAITTLSTGGAGSLSVGAGGVTIAGGGFTYSGAATNFAVSAQTSGLITLGGTSGTGIITLGQSTVSQTTNIQAGVTASGSTKTINLGTSGATGSTTSINIGSSTGTSTTTINGAASAASTLTVGSTLTVNGGTASIVTGTGSNTANISTGATLSGNTKAVNIGTSGVSGSTTTITIGSTFGTTTTVNGSTVFTGTFQSQGYTVATLPTAGTAGRRAHVTDALAPTFLGTLTGGGSVRCPVFDNGTAWVAG